VNPSPAQAEQSAALEAIKELLEAHFREAEDSADDDGRFSISFKATFDRSHSPTKLKVTSRINRTLTDELETSVADPNQPDLPLA
jgi:hypothetical protein